MGKKKSNGVYNEFLDGEKLRDNAEIRYSLQDTNGTPKPSSLPLPLQNRPPKSGSSKHKSSKPTLTHFICLPLVTESSRPSLDQGLRSFKQKLEEDGSVPIKAVRPTGTLHLTLGVMSLNEESLQRTFSFLRDLDLHRLLRDVSHQRLAEKAAEEGAISENLIAANMPSTDALSVNLESLVPMQAAHKTSILYAEPKDASARLILFATALKEYFEKEGLLVQDTRPLKLHATVLNTIYAKSGGRGSKKNFRSSPGRSSKRASQERSNDAIMPEAEEGAEADKRERAQGHGPDAKSWMRFDASKLIEEYKGFVWAQDIQVDRVQICKMGAKKIWSGGSDGEGDVLDEQYEVVCEKGIFE